jgi:hypothetical protein
VHIDASRCVGLRGGQTPRRGAVAPRAAVRTARAPSASTAPDERRDPVSLDGGDYSSKPETRGRAALRWFIDILAVGGAGMAGVYVGVWLDAPNDAGNRTAPRLGILGATVSPPPLRDVSSTCARAHRPGKTAQSPSGSAAKAGGFRASDRRAIRKGHVAGADDGGQSAPARRSPAVI